MRRTLDFLNLFDDDEPPPKKRRQNKYRPSDIVEILNHRSIVEKRDDCYHHMDQFQVKLLNKHKKTCKNKPKSKINSNDDKSNDNSNDNSNDDTISSNIKWINSDDVNCKSQIFTAYYKTLGHYVNSNVFQYCAEYIPNVSNKLPYIMGYDNVFKAIKQSVPNKDLSLWDDIICDILSYYSIDWFLLSLTGQDGFFEEDTNVASILKLLLPFVGDPNTFAYHTNTHRRYTRNESKTNRNKIRNIGNLEDTDCILGSIGALRGNDFKNIQDDLNSSGGSGGTYILTNGDVVKMETFHIDDDGGAPTNEISYFLHSKLSITNLIGQNNKDNVKRKKKIKHNNSNNSNNNNSNNNTNELIPNRFHFDCKLSKLKHYKLGGRSYSFGLLNFELNDVSQLCGIKAKWNNEGMERLSYQFCRINLASKAKQGPYEPLKGHFETFLNQYFQQEICNQCGTEIPFVHYFKSTDQLSFLFNNNYNVMNNNNDNDNGKRENKKNNENNDSPIMSALLKKEKKIQFINLVGTNELLFEIDLISQCDVFKNETNLAIKGYFIDCKNQTVILAVADNNDGNDELVILDENYQLIKRQSMYLDKVIQCLNNRLKRFESYLNLNNNNESKKKEKLNNPFFIQFRECDDYHWFITAFGCRVKISKVCAIVSKQTLSIIDNCCFDDETISPVKLKSVAPAIKPLLLW